jgi:putative YhdH/YhfP family quinone oxidoreductase
VRFAAYLLSKAGAVIRPAVVELADTDLPEGDVLVRVEWSAINFKDAMVTRPGNRVAQVFPLVPGVELTGRVEESTSPQFAPGQHVLVQGYDLGVDRHGGFAAYARVPADWVVPLPDTLTCRTAAIIGLAGCTALLSLRRLVHHGTMPDDGPILVTGASGGVGSAAVALLAHAGFEVVASSGKTAEHEYLKRLGAARVVGREFTRPDVGTAAVGGRRRLRRREGAGRGAPHRSLWRRRRGERVDRRQRSGHDRLSVHCARRRPVGDRHRGDAD